MRRAHVLACALLVVAACGNEQPAEDPECASAMAAGVGKPRAWPPARAGYTNPIIAENAKPGDRDWQAGSQAAPHVEAYSDRVSAHAGAPRPVMVRSDEPRALHFGIYRLGWYDGAGARLVQDGVYFSGIEQPACPMQPTGMIACRWAPSFSFTVGDDWTSGLYVVRVDADVGRQLVPLIVTDERAADLLV